MYQTLLFLLLCNISYGLGTKNWPPSIELSFHDNKSTCRIVSLLAGPNLLPVDVELREEGGSLAFNPCSLQLVRRHVFRRTTSTGYNTSIV
jgi:hypothetical protein